MQLSALARQLEHAARDGNTDRAAEIADLLKTCAIASAAVLREWLEAHRPSSPRRESA
jgi:hypothetical protein